MRRLLGEPPARHGGRCSLLQVGHYWAIAWSEESKRGGGQRLWTCQNCGAHFLDRSDILYADLDDPTRAVYWDPIRSRVVTLTID